MSRGIRYTAEFKQRAVELYKTSGASFSAIAKELGINSETLASWVKKSQNDTGCDNPFQKDEELRKLRREVARLKEENEILLKASAFFASKQL